MRKLNRILIPTDLSEGSRKAYQYSESLLRVFGGTVDMIHVVPTFKYLHESMKKVGYPFSLDHDVYPQIIEQTEEKVREELERYIPEQHRGDALVRIGRKAYEVILETSQKGAYDLILMGAQGLHADNITRGHVTEKVIRYSTKPVLSVSGSILADETEQILVPTDFSDFSLKAVLPAAITAGRLNAGITLFHVKELHGSEPNGPADMADEAADEAFRSRVVKRLEEFYAQRPKAGVQLQDRQGERLFVLHRDEEKYEIPLQIERVRGISAHYEIVDYAEEHAQMIVIATHGRTGLLHMFLGSTSEKVVERARIPVLTIRPKEAVARMKQ